MEGVPSRNRLRAISEVNMGKDEFYPQRLGVGKEDSVTLVLIVHSASICKGSHVSGTAPGDTEMNERGRDNNWRGSQKLSSFLKTYKDLQVHAW